MKKFILFIIFGLIAIIQYGQVIADHTIVEDYDKIPQQYIDEVKKMLVNIGGMSHALGYNNGVALLELSDPRFQVLTFTTEPIPPYSDQYLRLGRPYMVGIESFYTSQAAIDTYKSVHLRYGGASNPYNVVAFGWSYQATWVNAPGGTPDPVYNVRWAGSSEGGPDGDKIWGLDSDDIILTGNRVSMDTYLDAMEQYIQYCTDNNYPTIMLFTNGVVDSNSGTESAYQRELKNQHIRNYIQGKEGYYFFDYADILIHNNAGEHYTANWNDGGTLRAHDQIHPDNLMDYDASWNIIPSTDSDGDHIGEVGALRLGKAMWWILARMAGWDGGSATGSRDQFPVQQQNKASQFTIGISNDELRIQSPESLLPVTINLYNINGNLITTKKTNNTPSLINVSQLPSGLYLVRISTAHIIQTHKIIIP
jgi:hypothetical protein